jgi:hypothetical protein
MPLGVTFSGQPPAAAPGGETDVTVEVTNLGEIVEEISVEVLGDLAEHARVFPPSLHLYPGAVGTTKVTFRAPEGHAPGPVPFGIRARSTITQESAIEESSLEVTSQSRFSAELRPRQSRARRKGRHRVTVFNDGNVPLVVRLSSSDPDDLLGFTHVDRLEVPTGGVASARVTARVAGGRRGDIMPFAVNVDDGIAPVTLDGSVRTERRRLYPFVAVIAVVAGLLVAFVVTRPPDAKSRTAPIAVNPNETTTVGPTDGSAVKPNDQTTKPTSPEATKPGGSTTLGTTKQDPQGATTTTQKPLVPPTVTSTTKAKVAVPDLYKRTITDALGELKSKGFTVTNAFAYTASTAFTDQTIWGQYPAPGTMVSAGSSVAIMRWDKVYCDAHPDQYPRPENWCYESKPPREKVEPSPSGR